MNPITSSNRTANVVFFRASEANGYDFMPVPKTLGLVTSAADSHPKTVNIPNAQGQMEMKLHPNFAERASKKIKAIFEIAKENGHDAIVLSAFGYVMLKDSFSHKGVAHSGINRDTLLKYSKKLFNKTSITKTSKLFALQSL